MFERRIYLTERKADSEALREAGIHDIKKLNAVKECREGVVETVRPYKSFIPSEAEMELMQLPQRLIRPEEIEFSRNIKKLQVFFTQGKMIRIKNTSNDGPRTIQAMVTNIITSEDGAHIIRVIYDGNGKPIMKYVPALSAVTHNNAPFAEKHGENMEKAKSVVDFLINRQNKLDENADTLIGAHAIYKGQSCYILGTEGSGGSRVFTVLFDEKGSEKSDKLKCKTISLESFSKSAQEIEINMLPRQIAENWYKNTSLGYYRVRKAA